MTPITDILALIGALFMFLASLGLIRLPDFYTRMHSASKASILGLLLIATETGITLGSLAALLHTLLVSLFFVLTTPIAAHLLGRAAYLSGIRPLVARDDLRGATIPRLTNSSNWQNLILPKTGSATIEGDTLISNLPGQRTY